MIKLKYLKNLMKFTVLLHLNNMSCKKENSSNENKYNIRCKKNKLLGVREFIIIKLKYFYILMGGISEIIYKSSDSNIGIDFLKSFLNIKHRGTDDTSYTIMNSVDLNTLSREDLDIVYYNLSKDEIRRYTQYTFVLGFHRSTINDLTFNGSQPFVDPIVNKIKDYPDLRKRPKRQMICNGEIYNTEELILENNFTDHDLCSFCDVEIILPMYIKYGINEMLMKLNGDFAFILNENIETYKTNEINVFAVKDFLGIKPLYYVYNSLNNIYFFVSEIKALPKFIISNVSYYIDYVKPGTYWSFQSNDFTEYYSLDKYKSLDNCVINKTDPDTLNSIYTTFQTLITQNVIDRYNNSHKIVGILLSGGFDSCIITSIIVKYLISINNNFDKNPLYIFTIGQDLSDSDSDYASNFILFLENKYNITLVHHIIYINQMHILTKDLETIIYHLESYDPDTVRKCIPFYFLLDYIKKNTNVKVLLSGDGLDEFCVYSANQNTDDASFQQKSVELLQNMYQYELLRTDKISNIFGLEVRHPYLEKRLVEYTLSLHPKLKKPQKYSNTQDPITKYIIRKAFEKSVYSEELIPEMYLWRAHKNILDFMANFTKSINAYFNSVMSDIEYNIQLKILLNEPNVNQNTLPKSKEELFYRMIFRGYFPNRDYLVKEFWINPQLS
jgi:asparagine synthase (glutamine-hydrolysing)